MSEIELLQEALGEERLRADLAEDLADELAKALRNAQENMECWAAYASEYFREKWDLEGDLQECEDALTKWREARS